MKRDEAIQLLRASQAELARLGVESLRLFGSVGRDEFTAGSDIDLVVGFSERATFDGYMDLKFYLEDLLGSRVDLLTESALRPWLRSIIDREGIRVA